MISDEGHGSTEDCFVEVLLGGEEGEDELEGLGGVISDEDFRSVWGGFIEELLGGEGGEVISDEGFGGIEGGFIEGLSEEEEGGDELVGVGDEVSKDLLIVGHGWFCEDDSRGVFDFEGAS